MPDPADPSLAPGSAPRPDALRPPSPAAPTAVAQTPVTPTPVAPTPVTQATVAPMLAALARAQTEAQVAAALAPAADALGLTRLIPLLADGGGLRGLSGEAAALSISGEAVALVHAAVIHEGAQNAPGRFAVPLSLDSEELGHEVLGTLLAKGEGVGAAADVLATLATHTAAALGRVRTLEELRGRDARMHDLLEHSPVGLVIGQPGGRIEEVNAAYLALLGYTREQFLAGEVGWPVLPGTGPQGSGSPDAARGPVAEALRLGHSGPHATSALTRSGQALPLSVTLVRVGAQARPQLAAYVRDLREQAAAEQLLHDRTASLQALISEGQQELGVRAEALLAQHAELAIRTRALDAFALLSRDLVLETDRLALVRRAQEITVDLLPPGYAVYYEPQGPLWRLRSQVGELGHPELQAVVDAGLPLESAQNLNQPWQTGQPLYQDTYDINTDQLGELVRHIGATASLPVMLGGRPVGVFAVALLGRRRWSATDRTVMETATFNLGLALERAQAMAQLATRTEELERSNAELERFAYVASHDLQAPLRAMTSFADLIAHRYGQILDERGQLYLQQISDNGVHMKRLVDDLLGFSRLHTGRLETEACDMNAVFDQLRLRLHDEIVALGAQVTRGGLPTVPGHAAQLDQLLQNLVQNGLKYRREGVTPTVEVSARREGQEWVFAVRDNGIGIEPQHFERIFVIFQRLHGREQYEGTGIGLAICQKIVERHGGRLWVESTPGEGSMFLFTLPAQG